MKTLTLSIFLVAILFSQVVLGESLEDFGNSISYFYLAPSEEAFITFQHTADRLSKEIASSRDSGDLLIAVMIARISAKYSWPIAEGAFSAKAHEILTGESQLAKFVSDDKQVDPTKLDVWWASFFATGDDHYLDKILQYAGLDLPTKDTGRMLVIGAATWSFKANCQQHKRVLEYAKGKLASPSLPQSQVKLLEDCVASAESKGTEQLVPPDRNRTLLSHAACDQVTPHFA